MGEEVRQKPSHRCAIDGCIHQAEYTGLCVFHQEAKDRGQRETFPLVTKFAMWSKVIRLVHKLHLGTRRDLESEIEAFVQESADLGISIGIDPSLLVRQTIKNFAGEDRPEPAARYSLRIENLLARFVCDRASEQMRLPAVGGTVLCKKNKKEVVDDAV